MDTVYRKTERGILEVATREQRLAPRLRSALILIDGKRLLRELQGLLGPCHAEALRALEDLGLIEGRRPIYIIDPQPSATASGQGGPRSVANRGASRSIACMDAAAASCFRDWVLAGRLKATDISRPCGVGCESGR